MQFLTFKITFTAVPRKYHPHHHNDVLVFASIVSGGLGSAFVPFFYVVTGYDPLNYFQEIFITCAMYRSLTTIILAFFARLFFAVTVGIEIFRTVAFMGGIAIVFLGRIKTLVMVVFEYKRYSVYFRYYQQARCMYSMLETYFTFMAYVLLSTLFWALVILCCICVIFSPVDIPAIIYWTFVGFFIFVLLATYIILSKLCYVLEAAQAVVKFYELRVKCIYKLKRTKASRYDYLQARSVRFIRQEYAFFGYMGKDFMADYFEALIENCLNTLIMLRETLLH